MKERATFAELAVELKMIAQREAMGAEQLELLAARSGERVFAVALQEARLSAERAGDAFRLLFALIPHEEAVRALLDPLSRPSADAEGHPLPQGERGSRAA